MKKVILLFALLLMLFSCENALVNEARSTEALQQNQTERVMATQRGDNLLSNPSFENSSSSTSPWRRWGSGHSVTVSSSQSHTGSRSMKMPFDNSYWSDYARVDITDDLLLNHNYYFEMWAKISGTLGTENDVFCHIGFTDPDSPQYGISLFFKEKSVSANGWVKLSGNFTYVGQDYDPDLSDVCLYVASYSNGSPSAVYIDDVHLEDMGVVNLRPFPQNESFSGCIRPASYSDAQLNSDITDLYDAWKDEFLLERSFTNGAVNKSFDAYVLEAEANGHLPSGWGSTGAISQSEAHGYSMILMALMAEYDSEAKQIFDSMYQLYVNYPCADNSNLMSWCVPSNGNLSLSAGASATDGDMDVAYALLLANDQWGAGPEGIPDVDISYYDAAVKIIEALEDNNIYDDNGEFFPRLGIGDNQSSSNYYKYRVTRSSDFMLSHCDLFYRVTGDNIWNEVADTMVDILEHYQDDSSNTTGLIPDFMGSPGADFNADISSWEGISDESGGKYDNKYYYNGCRLPWRLAMAYAHCQDGDARSALNEINGWLPALPSNVHAGYTLGGEYEIHGNDDQGNPIYWQDNSFTGPFTAGLMVSSNRTKLKTFWDYIADYEVAGSGEQYTRYYQNTTKLLSMLLISGNWWEPGASEFLREGDAGNGNQYPEWTTNQAYNVGDLVQYNGQTWRNTFYHVSNIAWYPGAPGLWFWQPQ